MSVNLSINVLDCWSAGVDISVGILILLILLLLLLLLLMLLLLLLLLIMLINPKSLCWHINLFRHNRQRSWLKYTVTK